MRSGSQKPYYETNIKFYVHINDSNDQHKIPLGKNTFSAEINVKEDTKYSIQINAYEDGLNQSGNNWSNEVYFQTSRGGKFN